MKVFNVDASLRSRILRSVKMIALIALAGLAVFAIIIALRQPSHDREWRAEIAVMPHVKVEGQTYTIDQVRDWTYSADAVTSDAYHSGVYNAENLVGTWLMVEPFGGSDAIAHTLILFEFTGERMLALTIEARKEEGEIYSAVKGVFRSYELVYLWAEARDVLTRRARYLDHDIFIYPIALTPDERKAFFGALVKETNRLYDTPRFYNTLFSNCTNELAKTAGLKWSTAFITTGYAPQHLFKTGTIPGKTEGLSFDALKVAANVTELIETANDADTSSFDAAFLQALKKQFRDAQTGPAG